MRSRWPPAWIVGSLLIGVLLSVGVFLSVRRWEERDQKKYAVDLVHQSLEQLNISILRSMEVLYSIASFRFANQELDLERFRNFAVQALHRQTELQALSWNPVISAAERNQFERMASASFAGYEFREKDAAGRLIPAKDRTEFVPVYLIEPLTGNRAALGFDLGSDPSRRSSMDQARDTGEPVATAPVQLAQGPKNEAGFLVLLPIYNGGAMPQNLAQRRASIAGYAVAVFRVERLVNGLFGELKKKGIDAEIRDLSETGELIYSNREHNPSKFEEAPFDFAGRRWTVLFAPTAEFMAMRSHAQSWIVLAAGLIFAFVSAAYLYGGWRRTVEVAAANAALQEEVSIRERAERVAACANEAKSEFLANISHEIRTPLNAILGYTQLMGRDPQLLPEQKDGLNAIGTSGRHLLGLINEILDLAKIEAGRMDLNAVDFDLGSLARDLETTFRPLCAQKRIGFRLAGSGIKNSHVRGDEGKLRQVLINLLGNAAKFTMIGEIYLDCRPQPDGRWLFEVIDNGLGIPEEEREDIFKSFHQGRGSRSHGGTGLGLAIAKRQVELLGGKLEVHSERGVGSRFFFTIPLEAAQEIEESAPILRAVRLVPGQVVRVLVVDDNKENREVLGGMLGGIGCTVTMVCDGESAVAEMANNTFDLVILDLLLPGISGFEVARYIADRFEHGSPKVIAHSASARLIDREQAFAAGCVDFIAKPFECERLYESMALCLGVTFEKEETGAKELASTQPRLIERVILPEVLCERLMTAAELHSTTALKACLQELRAHGPAGSQLADEIRLLMRSYDMDGIQILISRLAVSAEVSGNSISTHALSGC